jgi:hypothetical protein
VASLGHALQPEGAGPASANDPNMRARPSDPAPRELTMAERRVLASFVAGRLAAGQLDAELARCRSVRPAAPPPVPGLRPAAVLRAA